MKKILLGLALALALALALTGCGDEPVLMTTREVVVVKPDPITYAQCPQTVTIPPVSDTNSGRNALDAVYVAYDKCRTVVQDVQVEIDRLEKDATKDNPPAK